MSAKAKDTKVTVRIANDLLEQVKLRCEEDDALKDPGQRPSDHFPAMNALAHGGKQTTLQKTKPPGKYQKYHNPDHTLRSPAGSPG